MLVMRSPCLPVMRGRSVPDGLLCVYGCLRVTIPAPTSNLIILPSCGCLGSLSFLHGLVLSSRRHATSRRTDC